MSHTQPQYDIQAATPTIMAALDAGERLGLDVDHIRKSITIPDYGLMIDGYLMELHQTTMGMPWHADSNAFSGHLTERDGRTNPTALLLTITAEYQAARSEARLLADVIECARIALTGVIERWPANVSPATTTGPATASERATAIAGGLILAAMVTGDADHAFADLCRDALARTRTPKNAPTIHTYPESVGALERAKLAMTPS